jgi:hypothetical protein
MEEQCRQAILVYANDEMQRNASLLGEHKEYVTLVLKLFRDDYHNQVNQGATEYIVPKHITDYLDSIKPW